MYTRICETRMLQSKQWFEIGLIISLILHISLFLFGNKRLEFRPVVKEPRLGPIKAHITPKTVQKRKVNPPSIPKIPIPSEQEQIPTNIPILVWNYQSTDQFLVPIFPDLKEYEPIKFVDCHRKPYPIGGFSAIGKHLKYPEMARKLNVEGIVRVRVLFDESGNILHAEIIKSLGPYGCDEEAVRAIRAVKWIPALQRDQPVKVWIEIPIHFQLKSH